MVLKVVMQDDCLLEVDNGRRTVAVLLVREFGAGHLFEGH